MRHYGYYVETHLFGALVACHVLVGSVYECLPFAVVYSFFGINKGLAGTRLHFHYHHFVAVKGYDVYFVLACTVIAFHYCVPYIA